MPPVAETSAPPSFLAHDYPLAAPEVRQNPFPYYAWLREHAPCQRSGGVWLISRYEDVNSLLRNRTVSSDLRNADEPLLAGSAGGPGDGLLERLPLGGAIAGVVNDLERSAMGFINRFSMIGLDPPDHTRMRGLVRAAFTPRAVARMEEQIAARAAGLLDSLDGRRSFDLISSYGYPLPLQVVTDMLGIPADEEDRMRRWSDALSRSIDPATSAAVRRRGYLASAGFTRFLDQLIRERRKDPREDLLTELIAVADEGEKLSRAELIGNTVLLIAAGHETTTNLIGNGTLALLRHPDQLEALREDPSLAPSAVEEILRYDSPGQLTYRTATEPLELHGQTIEPGEQMILLIGSANRDPEVFDEPDRFDITRDGANNIAFGAGPHHCLGAALARLEGKIALPALLERGELELHSEPSYRDNLVHRGLSQLRVGWARA